MEKITLSEILLNRLNFRILTFKCLMPVLFVFGVIFFLLNIIPIKVNFETHNNIVIAHVSKRELFPPLKKINKDLYDVKQAILAFEATGSSSPNSVLALEYDNGRQYTIIPIDSDPDKKLLSRMNTVIKRKLNYTFKIRNTTNLFIGAFVTIISGLFVIIFMNSYIWILKEGKNVKIPVRRKQQPKSDEQNMNFPKQNNNQPNEFDEYEKYNNINDSIIK